MNGETLRLEIGIHRSHSSSSPQHIPLQPGDEQPCSATRTFSCPRPRRGPEETEYGQNRVKARPPEALLGLLTSVSTVGMTLRLPSACTRVAVLARPNRLPSSL